MTYSNSGGLKVFLSHSKPDRLVVNEVKENLESNGLDVYIYEDDRRPGTSIPDKVKNAISIRHSVGDTNPKQRQVPVD
jgi:hypothetical protein